MADVDDRGVLIRNALTRGEADMFECFCREKLCSADARPRVVTRDTVRVSYWAGIDWVSESQPMRRLGYARNIPNAHARVFSRLTRLATNGAAYPAKSAQYYKYSGPSLKPHTDDTRFALPFVNICVTGNRRFAWISNSFTVTQAYDLHPRDAYVMLRNDKHSVLAPSAGIGIVARYGTLMNPG